MATAPKMKPVKGAGKQKGPAQTPNSEADTSAPSLFQQGMWAARDLWMGPPDGEPGELEKETRACETSTEEAIRSAEPTKKLPALRHGVDELQEKLCASATAYYNKCFELALRNRAELDTTLSVVAAELCRTAPVSNPAEFARAWTTADLSTFLRVTALDGKEKAQEIGSDGRVREFIRHVCGDYSDVLVLDPEAEQNKVFLLPRWPIGRTVGARMAQWWRPPANGDESGPLNLEETEHFILGTEEILIKNLRRAIAHAHRRALVDQANVLITTSSLSDTSMIAANVSENGRTKPTPRRSNERIFRMSVIFKALDAGKTGLDYCDFLGRHKLTTPKPWQLDDCGCPASYSLAYQEVKKKGRKYRRLIVQEKSRHCALRSELERENPASLRRIIASADQIPRS